MRIYKFLYLLISSLVLGGCERFERFSSKDDVEKDNLEIQKIEFSPDFKTFTVDMKVKDNTAFNITDIQKIKVNVTELKADFKKYEEKVQPKFKELKNIKAQEFKDMNLNILVLVDLTLDKKSIETQKVAVQNLRTFLTADNLHVAFIGDNTVSESMPASDYVLENYFKPNGTSKYLYRVILSKIDELNGVKSNYYSKVKQDSVWQSLTQSQKALVIFSDGKVYEDENIPMDDKHFEMQRTLTKVGNSLESCPIYYVNFSSDSEEEPTYESEAIFTLLCKQTGGTYFPHFSGLELANEILGSFNHSYSDYQLTLENPDYKVYRGTKRWLKIDCLSQDSLIAVGHGSYLLGSVYNPVIVNGKTTKQVLLKGGFFTIIGLIALYILFQFIIPYVRYCIFRKKYVVKYTNKNMSVNGVLIDQSCYFCKAPFVEGEEIVVKCSHVLHKSCWDENEYKCTEYGKNCKEGSHYYNRKNLLDSRNTSFYFLWIVGGILAGVFAWTFFTMNIHEVKNELLRSFLFYINEVTPDSVEATALLNRYTNSFYYSPFYGLNICFFLTLFLSILSGHGRWLWKRSIIVLVKALVAGICGYLSFLLGSIISIVFDLYVNSIWVEWIPWALMGFVVAYIVSFGTDIKLKRALVGATISIIPGLGSMYMWYYALDSQVDMRDLLLLSYIVYGIGLAISLAMNSPKSERYFLRVEGPIKEMDIAIYKWMNALTYNRQITIGKSVNCNLQMSWDLNSQIAPVQAILSAEYGNIYLMAEENGVYMDNKPLKVNKKVRLYHGTRFVIGQTIFTYVEKDI